MSQLLCSLNKWLRKYKLLLSDGRDYNGRPTAPTVKIGSKTKSFSIPIIDDNIVECDETFKVTIPGVSLCGITIGSVNVMDVTIIDDDSK